MERGLIALNFEDCEYRWVTKWHLGKGLGKCKMTLQCSIGGLRYMAPSLTLHYLKNVIQYCMFISTSLNWGQLCAVLQKSIEENLWLQLL